MSTTNDVRPGQVLNLSDGLCQILEYQHVKPGKGKAFVRMKLKRLDSGAVLDRTFRAGEKKERAFIEKRDQQFLYKDADDFVVMDAESYDQMTVPAATMGDAGNLRGVDQIQDMAERIVVKSTARMQSA